jgi:hypothetical protein
MGAAGSANSLPRVTIALTKGPISMATIRHPVTWANLLNSTKNGGKIGALGIAWYTAEDYARARAIMADGDAMPLTQDEWQHRIAKTEQDLIAQGHKVFRVIIDPRTFPGWCDVRGLDLNAKARTAFAAEEAARQIGL